MIIMTVDQEQLNTGTTIYNASWQVATSPGFEAENIVVESLNDSVNTKTIIFDQEVNIGHTYYGRAQLLTSKGLTQWSNVDVFIPTDSPVENTKDSWPTLIATPVVTTQHDKKEHPSSSFVITTSGFKSDGGGKHTKSHWVITDLHGVCMWSSYQDTVNLTSMFMTGLLPGNAVYRISVAHVSSSGDVSRYGSTIIYVPRSELVDVATMVEGPLVIDENDIATIDTDVTVIVRKLTVNGSIDPVGFNGIKYELTHQQKDGTVVVDQSNATYANMLAVFITAANVEANTKYILKIKALYDGKVHYAWSYITYVNKTLSYPEDPTPYDENVGANYLDGDLPFSTS